MRSLNLAIAAASIMSTAAAQIAPARPVHDATEVVVTSASRGDQKQAQSAQVERATPARRTDGRWSGFVYRKSGDHHPGRHKRNARLQQGRKTLPRRA